MSEHHEHTEFLKHCLRYDDGPERHAMIEKLARLQRELRIVRRASLLAGVLIALTGTGLAYPVNFVQNFPDNVQPFIMNFVLALFAGLSICLLTFIILEILLHKRLHCQRKACRQLLMHLFAARLDSAQHS